MAFGATITKIVQLPPITSPTAKVEISLMVEGTAPLQLQIYGQGAGDTTATLLETVTLNALGATSTTVTVVAGTEYFFTACPRTSTGKVLDDTIDGEPWETFCSAKSSFVTQAQETAAPSSGPYPYVEQVTNYPATIHGNNRIHIDWGSTYSYTHMLFRYALLGQPMIQQEGAGGQQGFFEINAQPNATYQFSLDGDNTWPNAGPNSGWSKPETVVAGPNSPSLRAFLNGVSAANGIRSLMKGSTDLRAWMQL